MQAMIGAPYPPHFNADPKNAAEWKELIDRRAKLAVANIPAMKEKLGVKVEESKIAGVHCFIVTPGKISPENRRRLLVHPREDKRQDSPEAHGGQRAQHDEEPAAAACGALTDDVVAFQPQTHRGSRHGPPRWL